MTRRQQIGLLILGSGAALLAALVGTFFVLRAERKLPLPPLGAHVTPPWGSSRLDELVVQAQSLLEDSLEDSVRAETPAEFDENHDGVREYDLLALSGGGSIGAFGAGFLCGWTAAGTRPDFKVVTGVST